MTEDKGILIRNVYYMLSYAYSELRQNNYENIACEEFEHVYDLFAEILSRGLSSLLKKGLHKTYVSQSDSLTTLRGQLDINGTIVERLCRNMKLACCYDEYSENCEFNRILKSTCVVLIRHHEVKAQRKKTLRSLLRFFDNVSEIALDTIAWQRLRFDRNTRAYRMLLYLCYFVINDALLTTDDGGYRMRQFSDEHMCRLYERFILEYYKRHHPELGAEARRIDWNVQQHVSDMSVLPIMKSDVVLHFSHRTLIIDAKYYGKTMQKNFGKSTIHSNNLYQIQSYVYNYDREHSGKVDGMLLYAKTQEEIVPDGQMVLNDGNTIYFRTLDLNQSFEEIKKELDCLIVQ